MAKQSLRDKTDVGIFRRILNALIKYVFIFIALCSILVIIDGYIPLLFRKYYLHTYKSLTVEDGDEFEKQIRDAAYNLIESESWGAKPMAGSNSLFKYILNKSLSNSNVMDYGEFGYLLHYTFLYAEKRDDQAMMTLIKEKFDKYWLNDSNLSRIDQTTYGNVALDLYLRTHQHKYKVVADKFCAYLDSLDRLDGIILYPSNKIEQDVDGIGLVSPFLFYYSDVFKSSRAQSMAVRMVEDFVKWGADPITGIPCQTYDIRNHIKKRHVNWGRGTSWYLLGVSQLVTKDSLISKRVEVLDSTLLKLDTYYFTHYLGQQGLPDMSATIPILYYLNTKKYIKLSKDQLAEILSPYIDHEGVIRFGSPSISFPHDDVNALTTNLFCQGLLLYFLSEIN